jgi:hypothetical protein
LQHADPALNSERAATAQGMHPKRMYFNYISISSLVSLAFYATWDALFALAQIIAVRDTEPAFQASSPKPSKARPATSGPFLSALRSLQRVCNRPISA